MKNWFIVYYRETVQSIFTDYLKIYASSMLEAVQFVNYKYPTCIIMDADLCEEPEGKEMYCRLP